jgi:hypothetical protein
VSTYYRKYAMYYREKQGLEAVFEEALSDKKTKKLKDK